MNKLRLDKIKKDIAAAEKKNPKTKEVDLIEILKVFKSVGIDHIERFNNCITLIEVMELMTLEELNILIDSEEIDKLD